MNANARSIFSAGRDPEWRNRLVWEKYVLPSLLEEFAGKVNLTCIDPPFNVGADFSFTATIPSTPLRTSPDNPETDDDELVWQAAGITRIRRHRWPVQVYHEEGNAEGLDQDQVRDCQAIERHIGLVAVVYSLLRAAQHDSALQHTLQRQLELDLDEGSAAFWRRVTRAQSLWSVALAISAGVAQGQSLRTIMTPLVRAICAASFAHAEG